MANSALQDRIGTGSNMISGFAPGGVVLTARPSWYSNDAPAVTTNIEYGWSIGGEAKIYYMDPDIGSGRLSISTDDSWALDASMDPLSFNVNAVACEFRLKASMAAGSREEAAWGFGTGTGSNVVTKAFLTTDFDAGLAFGGTDEAAAPLGNAYVYAGDGTNGTLTALTAGAFDGAHKYKILFYPGVKAEFYLDDTLVHTATSNLPATTDPVNWFARSNNTDITITRVEAPTLNWTE